MSTRQPRVARDGTLQVQQRRISWTARGILGLLWLVRWAVWSVPRAVARRGWRHRWHLAPLAGAWWVLTTGPAAPVATLAALTATAVLAVFGARTKVRLGDRMHLGKQERQALAEGAIGAAGWTAGEWAAAAAGVHVPPLLTYAAYVALTGHAAGSWWWSRRPTWARREPKAVKHYTGQWDAVSATSTALGASYIRRDTIEVLRSDDVTFRVRLGDDHHAEDVEENERRAVERLIKGPGGADLPPGSVTIGRLPSTVNEVQVTISPQRAALSEPIDWPGVEPIPRDGATVLSREPSGRPIEIKQFGPNGTRNVTMIGSADSGKTSTFRVFGLRGPATLNDRGQPIETLLVLDGGKGTSAPEMAPAFLIHATQPSWWPVVFEAWCAILDGREARRGDPRSARSSWQTWEEEDPIMTLVLLEAPAITRQLTSTHDRMFAEALQRIRKCGMRVIVDTQELTRGNLPGGNDIETVRNQLFGNGAVLAHRTGTDDKRALQSSDEASRLTRQQNSLPAKGGWHIAIEQGQLLSRKTRSLWAPPERTAAEALRITPRPLAGPDLEAAMRIPRFAEIYEHRTDPMWVLPAPAEDEAGPEDGPLTSGPRPFIPAQPLPARDRVLQAITEHMAETGRPLGKTEANTKYGIAAGTWENGRRELLSAEKIHQPEPGVWAPVFPGGKP